MTKTKHKPTKQFYASNFVHVLQHNDKSNKNGVPGESNPGCAVLLRSPPSHADDVF